MKILIDSADLSEIKRVSGIFPVSGVTTNPKILASVGGNPYETIKAIRGFIGDRKELHVQVLSRFSDEMSYEAEKIRAIAGKGTFIKIPATEEGLKAMRALAEKGVKVTATAIFSLSEYILSAMAWATYAAPYVGTMEKSGIDGISVVKGMAETKRIQGFSTEILAASIKSKEHFEALSEAGVTAFTMAPQVFDMLMDDETAADAVRKQRIAFSSAFGEESTMLNLN